MSAATEDVVFSDNEDDEDEDVEFAEIVEVEVDFGTVIVL